MADLPSERVDPSPPFMYTGMDCSVRFLLSQDEVCTKDTAFC